MSQTTQSSNIEKNKQLVRNFVDVFNRHDMSAVDKYMAGGEGFKQYLGGLFLGHPDSRTTIDHIVGKVTQAMKGNPKEPIILRVNVLKCLEACL